MSPKIKKVTTFGWKNCYSISDGQIEMIATADIGPRIISFGPIGGKNFFKLFDQHLGKKNAEEWMIYGGHRLWSAPEDPVISYIPDNNAVNVEIDQETGGVSFVRPPDESNLEKKITMRVATKNQFVVVNELTNRGKDQITTASWGISSLAPGGIGFMPLNKTVTNEKRFQASASINLWPYTDFNDPAYYWKQDWLEIDQTKSLSKQKIGLWNRVPWLAYRLEDLFLLIQVKEKQQDAAAYPDFGSNSELYFDKDMLELEFLSPWKTLNPGESVSHTELWSLIKIEDGVDNDTAIKDFILPNLIELK